MAKEIKGKKDPKEEKQREHLAELYRNRFQFLKQGQMLYREEKISQAIESYFKYLTVLASKNDTTEDKLTPNMFDPQKDLSELLLISHAYWDLSKAFDRSPHHQKECLRCLDQFVKFSIGYKYQHVNAQIIRKFNTKKQAHNYKAFEVAYNKIHISSKKCYVATLAFGEEHPITRDLRAFKLRIQNRPYGLMFIKIYYQIFSGITTKAENNFVLRSALNIIFRPIIILIHRIVKYAFNL